MSSEYILFGFFYLIVIAVTAVKSPRTALCLSFALAPFQRALPGIPFKLTLADLNMVVTFIVFAAGNISAGRPLRLGPVGPAVFIYLAICIISSLGDNKSDSTLVSFAQMVPYLILAIILFSSFGQSLEDMRPALYVLLGIGVFLGLSTLAFFSGNIYGLNKNGLGSSLACITLVAAELWLGATDPRRKRIILFCMLISVAGLLITLSRGSWMGTIAGLLVILALRGDFKGLLRFALVLGPVLAVCWAALPEENKEFAVGFQADRANIKARWQFIDLAWHKFQDNPILGVGVGVRKDFDATNVVLTTLAETGVLGLAAFLMIHVVLLRMAWKAHHSLPKTSWAFSCLAIGVALPMAKLMHGLVDHYWSRGSILLAWAGVGMATRAYYVSQAARPHAGMIVKRPWPGGPRPADGNKFSRFGATTQRGAKRDLKPVEN